MRMKDTYRNILCICLSSYILGLSCASPLYASSSTSVSSYAELVDAISFCSSSSSCSIVIEESIVIPSSFLYPDPIKIQNRKDVSIRGQSDDIFITGNGNTSVFVVSGESRLHLTDLFFNMSAVSQEGLDIEVHSSIIQVDSSVLLLNGIVFNGVRALYGAAISAYNTSVVQISNSKFFSNSIFLSSFRLRFTSFSDFYGFGGAIFVTDSSLFLSDSSFIGNTAFGGGAIYVENSKNTTLVRVSFVNNTAAGTSGGALFALNSVISSEEITGKNNTAISSTEGGGFVSLVNSQGFFLRLRCLPNNFAILGGCIFVAFNSSLKCSNCTMLSNGEKLILTSFDLSRGGALYVGFNSKAELIGGRVERYLADYGGAIYVDHFSNVLVKGTSLKNNSAVTTGGAIYVDNFGTLDLSNSVMEFNRALSGGAVYCNFLGGSIILQSSEIRYSESTREGSAIYSRNCTVKIDNSKICFNKGIAETISISLGVFNTNISSCDISDNQVLGSGAALYFEGTADDSLIGNFYVKNCSFYRNKAAFDSGAIGISVDARGEVTESDFGDNSAGYKGGAIHIESRSIVSVTNCSFSKNLAGFDGGAISIFSGSRATILNSTFSGDTGDNGGAVMCNLDSICIIKNCDFWRTSSIFSGGAIAVTSGSKLLVDGGNIYFSSGETGGAIFARSDCVVFAEKLFISGSYAYFFGGTVHIASNSSASFLNITVENSTAQDGALLYIQIASKVVVENSFIRDVSASSSGSIGFLDSQSVVEIYGTEILNTSSSLSGGAIRVFLATVKISNCTIKGSMANNTGGFIHSISSNVSLVSSSFTNCTAEYGGVIHAESNSILISENNVYSYNIAAYGGVFYIEESTQDSFNDNFTDNTGLFFSGVVYVENRRIRSVSYVSCKFQRNTAALGSSILIVFGALNVSYTVFSQNNASSNNFPLSYYAGTVVGIGSSINIMESKFLSNTCPGGIGSAITTIQSGSTLENPVSNTSLKIHNSIFDSNVGKTGPAVFAKSFGYVLISGSRFSNNGIFSGSQGGGGAVLFDHSPSMVLNSTFYNNTAKDGGGGGLLWLGATTALKPNFVNVTFKSNYALYGPDYASGPFYLNPSTLNISNVRSGSALPDLNVTLKDFYDNTVSTEFSEESGRDVICRVSNPSCRVQGRTSASIEKGISVFNNLVLSCPPGSFTLIEFEYAALDQTVQNFLVSPPVNISYRYCIAGERFTGIECEECPFGTVLLRPPYQTSETGNCDVCPSHAICPGGSVIDVDAGFWRSSSISMNILECPVEAACLGGKDVSLQCANGHKGPYCSVCKTGYVPDSDGSCVSCENSAELGTVTGVSFTLLLMFLIAIYYKKKIKQTFDSCIQKFTDKLKQFPIFSTTKLKILVGFFQIVLQISTVLQIFFPSTFDNFLEILSFLDLNITLFRFNLGCSFTINFYTILLTYTLVPILLCGLTSIFCYCRHLISKRFNRKNPFYTKRKRNSDITYAWLIVSFLVFSPVSTIIFSTFSCETLDDGVSYLTADYSIQCDNNIEYNSYRIYAAFMIIVYPFGIPLLYLLALLHYKDKINPLSSTVVRADELPYLSQDVVDKEKSKFRQGFREIKKISFLYDTYKPSCWYFEVVECIRRLMIGTIPVLVLRGSVAQIVFVLMITLYFTALSMKLRPFKEDKDNQIALLCMWSIVLMLLSSLLIRVSTYENDTNLEAIGVILILVNLNVIIFSIYCSIQEVEGLDSDDEDDDDDDVVRSERDEDENKKEEPDSGQNRCSIEDIVHRHSVFPKLSDVSNVSVLRSSVITSADNPMHDPNCLELNTRDSNVSIGVSVLMNSFYDDNDSDNDDSTNRSSILPPPPKTTDDDSDNET